MNVALDCEHQGFQFCVTQEAAGWAEVVEILDAAKAAGIQPQRRKTWGREATTPESWEAVQTIRTFGHDGKCGLSVGLRPSEGSMDLREATAFDGEALLDKVPEILAVAIRVAWKEHPRGKTLSVGHLGLEAGIAETGGGKLRLLGLRKVATQEADSLRSPAAKDETVSKRKAVDF